MNLSPIIRTKPRHLNRGKRGRWINAETPATYRVREEEGEEKWSRSSSSKEKKEENAVAVMVPGNLKYREIMGGYKGGILTKYGNEAGTLWLISILTSKTWQSKDAQNAYHPLRSTELKAQIGEQYTRAIDGAVSCGIIEIGNDGDFIIGKKSRVFRLKEPYRSSPPVNETIENRALATLWVDGIDCRMKIWNMFASGTTSNAVFA